MNKVPDFYLASTESPDLAGPRAAYRRQRVTLDERDDALMVEVEPPVPGREWGVDREKLDFLILAPRHVGANLFPVSEWPIHVHVAVPNDATAVDKEHFRRGEYIHIAWGDLYRTKQEAVDMMSRLWGPSIRSNGE